MEGSQKYEGYLIAPNGKESNLTEAEWLYVRTDDYKLATDDWANTDLDENGESTLETRVAAIPEIQLKTKNLELLHWINGSRWRQVGDPKETHKRLMRAGMNGIPFDKEGKTQVPSLEKLLMQWYPDMIEKVVEGDLPAWNGLNDFEKATGKTLIHLDTVDKIVSMTKYFREGELLCTIYAGPKTRLKSHDIWACIDLKTLNDDPDQAKPTPEMDMYDDYSKSLMFLEVPKNEDARPYIISRYNHNCTTVRNGERVAGSPNYMWGGNDYDKIYPGLNSFLNWHPKRKV